MKSVLVSPPECGWENETLALTGIRADRLRVGAWPPRELRL
jgi:hypothetical protein